MTSTKKLSVLLYILKQNLIPSTANHKFAHIFPALQTPLNQGIMGLLAVCELMKRCTSTRQQRS